MSTAASSLRIHRLRITDFMRITSLDVDAKGNHITITGPNGSGKTSAVKAIWDCLAGLSTKDTPEPIHRGADTGEISLDLGEVIVTRRFTASGSTIKVVPRDGSPIKRPQDLLNTFFSSYSLDPVAFLSQRPQDQVDAILAICEIAAPVAAVKKITGEDHPVKPGESADQYLQRLSGDDTGVYYVRRMEYGRVVVMKDKAVQEAVKEVEAKGGRPTMEEKAEGTEELLAELNAIEAKRGAYDARVKKIEALEKRVKDESQKRDELNKRERDNRQEAQRIAEEIERLKGKMKTLIEDADDQAAAHKLCVESLEGIVAECRAANVALSKETDPSQAARAVRDKLQAAESRTRSLAARQQATSFLDTRVADHTKAVEDHNRVDGVLSELRLLRRNILDGIDLGIPGLSIGNGEVKLRGVSFKQSSNAEKLRVACAVAMKQNPRLKLLRVDNGEQLDEDSRALLIQQADTHGWQVVMTSVANTDGLSVEIADA